MKKIFSFFILLSLCVSLSSCNLFESALSSASSAASFYTVEDFSSFSQPSSAQSSSSDKSVTDDSRADFAVSSESNVSAALNASVISSSPSSAAVSTPETVKSPVSSSDASSVFVSKVGKDKELRAVWISYIELNFSGASKAQFEQRINQMMDNLKHAKMNAVVVHVRAFSDSYYESKLYPWAKNFGGVNPGYDPLAFMIEAAHKRGMEFHAWFNPFRVASPGTAEKPPSVSEIHADNPARKWREEGKKEWVVDLKEDLGKPEGGIYYNPTIPEVRKLIIDGVREVVQNYDIDGVHIDDYFYPVTDAAFDSASYERYKKSVGVPLTLDDWRRAQVNLLVTGLNAMVKHEKKTKPKLVFGISPAGNLDNNYSRLFADVKKWMSSDQYADYICPQIYFGFEYPTAKYNFTNLTKEWNSLPKHASVKLYIGLGPYKIGTQDAGSGEWQEKTDIIKRQIELSRTLKNYSGIMLFSYNAIFSASELHTAQRDNMLKAFS